MRKNWQKIIHDTYVELYKNSEPSTDFDNLVDNAILNDRGQKVINFMDYEITENAMDYIISSFELKYKMKNHEINGYRFAIYLGCSPKTKKI